MSKPLRVLVWGTYDLGKPRTRILIEGLRAAGVEVEEVHAPVWEQVADKSTVSSKAKRLELVWRWLGSYPKLLRQLNDLDRYDVVLVPYLGQLDVLVLWPWAHRRGVPVVWDQFISLYNTVIEDRRLVGPKHPLAGLLYLWEWAACRAADRVLMDTNAHADYVRDRFGVADDRVASVLVGAEPGAFPTRAHAPSDGPVHVLFYGQFIPLHGIETIVAAAQRSKRDIRWTIIGKGQETERIWELLADDWPDGLEWIEWVQYEALVEHIQSADLCLGIFGDTDKAARVIPNKVYQILHAGRPLITRDSPAIRELLDPSRDRGVYLVPPADPDALLQAIDRFVAERDDLPATLHARLREQTTPDAIGRALAGLLEAVVRKRTSAGSPRV